MHIFHAYDRSRISVALVRHCQLFHMSMPAYVQLYIYTQRVIYKLHNNTYGEMQM